MLYRCVQMKLQLLMSYRRYQHNGRVTVTYSVLQTLTSPITEYAMVRNILTVSIITRIFQELYLLDGYCIQDLVNKIVRIVLTTLPLHCISTCCVNITKQSGNSPTMLCYIFITGILRVKVNLLSAELYDTVPAERSSASTPNKTVICPSLPPSSHVSIYRLNIPTSQPVFMFQYHGWT